MDHVPNTPGAKKSEPRSGLTLVLFVIYAALLVSVILFKFRFNYQLANSGRDLNLIPFAGSFADHRGFGIGDVVENVLIFVPFGIYLSMLENRWSVGKKDPCDRCDQCCVRGHPVCVCDWSV